MAMLSTSCGRQVYYEDHGTGPAALVLVHGWGMSVRAWDPVLAALVGSGLRVVALDHRGCGNSDKDFADMSIEAIAGDVVALVAHLGLERVLLNGWSLGGAVAVQAAADLGDTCAGVVLTGGATPVYTRKPDFPHGGTDEDMAGTLAAFAGDKVNFLRGLSQVVCVKPVGADVEQWFWQIFLEASPLAGVTLGQLAQLDQRDMLRGLAGPVLSLYGSEDGFVAPDICAWVAHNHANARAVVFDGVGHAPFIEAREEYLAELVAFAGDVL